MIVHRAIWGRQRQVMLNAKLLGSRVAASLSKQLEMKHLRAYDFRIARGESLRIADAVPLYRDEGQQFPVLQIKPAETSAGATWKLRWTMSMFAARAA